MKINGVVQSTYKHFLIPVGGRVKGHVTQNIAKSVLKIQANLTFK